MEPSAQPPNESRVPRNPLHPRSWWTSARGARTFAHRRDAGRALAAALEHLRAEHPVVLGLPRGGVIVAAEVAAALDAPLDILVVRKLGAPGHAELAIGAVVDGDPPRRVLNEDLVAHLGVGADAIAAEEARQLAEARRRQARYRRGRPPVDLTGRVVIVVDDGIATGATVRAGLVALRDTGAARIVLAVPVGAPDSVAALRPFVDELVCLEAPADFRAVGLHYACFDQTTDEEVEAVLEGRSDGGAKRRSDEGAEG